MSYEPSLLINYEDLEKHRGHIEASSEMGIKPDKRSEYRLAYQELYKALQGPVIIFPERVSIVLISPELTSHNLRVRTILYTLNIEFKISN